MRDDLVDFWKYTAQKFNNTEILGYEFMNEPWAGNVDFAKFYDIIPSEAGKL